jgi:hypothetical protein
MGIAVLLLLLLLRTGSEARDKAIPLHSPAPPRHQTSQAAKALTPQETTQQEAAPERRKAAAGSAAAVE